MRTFADTGGYAGRPAIQLYSKLLYIAENVEAEHELPLVAAPRRSLALQVRNISSSFSSLAFIQEQVEIWIKCLERRTLNIQTRFEYEAATKVASDSTVHVESFFSLLRS